MRDTFQKRWVTIFAASLWILAASVQSLAPALTAFIPAPETEVEAAAIQMDSHRQGTCNHHPQGCPADCLCPKTGFVGEKVSKTPEHPGVADARLTGTSWVECSEARGMTAPSFAVYLPEAAREIRIFEISEPFVTPAPAPAREGLRAPPAKVPIA